MCSRAQLLGSSVESLKQKRVRQPWTSRPVPGKSRVPLTFKGPRLPAGGELQVRTAPKQETMQANDPSRTAHLSLLWKRRDRSRRSKKDSGVCAGCLPLSRTPGVRCGRAGAWGPQGCSPWTRAGTSQGAQPWCCRLEGPRLPSARPTCPRVQGGADWSGLHSGQQHPTRKVTCHSQQGTHLQHPQ